MGSLNSHHARASWMAACLALLVAAATGARVPAASAAVARGGPDLAVADDHVFVTDARLGKVLQRRLEGERLAMSELLPVPELAEVRQPVALDARGSRLVVLDAYGPTVFDHDRRTRSTKVLFKGSPLREPVGIAIAAGGSVAVVDPGARALFLIDDAQQLQIDRRVATPLQVEFDPSDGGLYVYDAERGLLRLEYSAVENFVQQRNAARIGVTPLSGISRVRSFAPWRGVVYVAEPSGLRIALPAKKTSFSVPDAFSRRSFGTIAVDATSIVGVDESAGSVDILPRPLPVSVNVDPDEGDPNAGVLALLEYLVRQRLVDGREVELDRRAEPYEEVLTRYRVLAPPRPGASSPDPARIRALFCGLNPRRCAKAPPGEDEDEVLIPRLQLEPYLAVKQVALAGKTVQTHIEEKVIDAEQREIVTADYVSRINPGADGTLESDLRRRNLVMAVPMSAALAPGTVIRIKGSGEEVVGDLASMCGVSFERETALTYLPETTITRTIAALPDAVRTEAGAGAAREVELRFDRAVRETIGLQPIRRCEIGKTEQAYLITESIRIDALHYRVAPPARRAAVSKVAARPQDKPAAAAWKSVRGPFVLAYKAVDLYGATIGLADRALLPAQIKPELSDAKAILGRTDGALNLPETHWRFDALVPASEFFDSSSPLAELRRAFPAIGLSSHERLQTSARSTFVRRLGDDEDVKAKLADERSKLLKVIAYSDRLARGTEDVDVAVGEADDQVNQDHPGFIHGGRSAWVELGPDGLGLVRRGLPPTAGAAAEVAIDRLPSTDHGTHVSGIVGARRSSLVPGLAPAVNLYLVDTARNLTDAIQDAYERGLIRLFNFSFAIESNQDLDEMKNRIVAHWGDALFVVAAGNEGLDLNAGGSKPLIDWVLAAPNILGVGATTADGSDVLGEFPADPADPNRLSKGSNFGSKFVQVVAPGQDVYSLGGGQYAFATGTSQAVPQVAAAAAMLFARGLTHPLLIKARIIATSSWREQYRKKVWGGLLNTARAVMHLNENVVWTQSAPQSARSLALDGNSPLTVRDARMYHPDGTETLFGSVPLRVRHILRLNHLGASRFRIVALDATSKLTILFGRLEGRIRCTDMNAYNPQTERFEPLPAGTANPCASGGVPADQIEEYVAKAAAIPLGVKF